MLSRDRPSAGTQLGNFKTFSHIPLDRLTISKEPEKQLTTLMAPASSAVSHRATLRAFGFPGRTFLLDRLAQIESCLTSSHPRQALNEFMTAMVIILAGYL